MLMSALLIVVERTVSVLTPRDHLFASVNQGLQAILLLDA